MLPRLIAIFSLYLISACLTAKPLPHEYFSHLPDVSRVTLSPNGHKLSSVIRIDANGTRGSGVQVSELSSTKKDIVLFTDNSKYFINWVSWKDDRTLLVGIYYPADRDTWTGMSQVRYKTRDLRLLIVDTETGEVRTPFKSTFLKKYKVLPANLSSIVDTLPDDPNHILMSLPSINNGWPGPPLVRKVNIQNQRHKKIQLSQDNTYGWMTDQQHRVRSAYYRKGGKIETVLKPLKGKKLKKIWPYEIFSEDEVNILGFGLNPNDVYIKAYHKGFLAVFKVNLIDKKQKRELVYSDDNYDVSGGLVYSSITKDVIGIGSTEEGGTIFFDGELKKLQLGINKALPNSRNYIYSFSDNMNKFIVFSTGPTESGTYYIGERNPTKLTPIAYRYKKLPSEVLSPVTKIQYKARDGLVIDGFLTLPKGKEAKNLPTIMFPHGGPISKDNNSFDYWAQYFANKGYAVLQMNFRGSAGRGLEFRNAGLKKWGKEMQDDIQDGAIKLIKDGISDPNAMCIVGASYGGYAALMGVVKTPDFYKCAISVAGVSDVKALVIENRAFWRTYNVVDEMIGSDHKELYNISPVNFADKIKVPVLLVHGDSDRQVKIDHSHRMRDALIKEKKNVTFLELESEDHYLSNDVSRVATFEAMDTFLDKYLPIHK